MCGFLIQFRINEFGTLEIADELPNPATIPPSAKLVKEESAAMSEDSSSESRQKNSKNKEMYQDGEYLSVTICWMCVYSGWYFSWSNLQILGILNFRNSGYESVHLLGHSIFLPFYTPSPLMSY